MVKEIQEKHVCPSTADLSVELWLDIDNKLSKLYAGREVVKPLLSSVIAGCGMFRSLPRFSSKALITRACRAFISPQAFWRPNYVENNDLLSTYYSVDSGAFSECSSIIFIWLISKRSFIMFW